MFFDVPMAEAWGAVVRKVRPISSQKDVEAKPVWVLSTGRVGTQTLSSLLALCRSFVVHHQSRPDMEQLAALHYQLEPQLTKNELAVFQCALRLGRENQIRYANESNKGYVETAPHLTFLAPRLMDSYPASLFIYLVRNPLMVVRSGMRRNWYGEGDRQIRIQPRSDDAVFQSWRTLSQFEKVIWFWTATNEWILDFAKQVHESNVLRLNSESLLDRNLSSITELYGFLGQEVPSSTKLGSVLRKRYNRQIDGDFEFASGSFAGVNQDLMSRFERLTLELGYGEVLSPELY